jgi:mannose-6-phosphate isomerase-like protein (cupin superfamily)
LESLVSDYIKRVDKVWGRECWITNTELYCAKILYINCKGCSSLHYHKIKDETFHILEGCCYLETFEQKTVALGIRMLRILHKGETIRIKPETPHRFFCSSGMELGCKVLEVSTAHSDEGVVRLEESKCLA